MIRCLALGCLLLMTTCFAAADPSPRVAVFDPVKGTVQTRFKLDPAAYDHAAQALREGGVHVDRLTAAQIADPAVFNAQAYDAVFFGDTVIPRSDIAAVKAFTEQGGVMINLGGNVPFLIAIEPGPDGAWQMAPMEPRFAWQTTELHDHFGQRFKYDPTLHDQGKRFTATPLLKRYLPDAADPVGPLPHTWLYTREWQGERGEVFPLIRARRVDGVDVTPQLYIARRGKRHAIFCLNPLFTDNTRPAAWRHSQTLLPALAHIAHDLRTGQLQLTDPMRVEVPETPAPLQPLRTRPAGQGVNPEGAAPVARFGAFDGSSMDLDAGPLPPTLAPGQTVTLDLPDYAGQAYLRVRAAYNQTGSGLCAAVGGQTLINETYIYNDPAGASNHAANPYIGLPVEFQRLAFIARPGRQLTLSNPGTQPIHLDAVQVETRTAPTPQRWTGVCVGMKSSYGEPTPIPQQITQQWSIFRCGARTQFVGPPGDAARWDRARRVLDLYAAVNPRWNFIFEGTPEWAALSPQRYQDGVKARRPHVVPPDTRKYAEIVEWVIDNYGQYIRVYEVWNETDIQQFWRGTPEEYVAFAREMTDLIRRKDPGKPVMLAGLAHANSEYLHQTRSTEVAAMTDLVGLHPYAGESVSWDVPYGKAQGTLYAMGDDAEVYCNESGYVWHNAEWYTSGWTPQRQHDALNTAMARLLSGDIAKLTLFNAGGDDHSYSLYDEQGKPRPAAAAFEDYVAISGPGARRLDVSLTPADGSVPLQGVYLAASAYPDGRAGAVLNAAESPVFTRRVALRLPWSAKPPSHVEARRGDAAVPVTAEVRDGCLTLTLEARGRVVIDVRP